GDDEQGLHVGHTTPSVRSITLSAADGSREPGRGAPSAPGAAWAVVRCGTRWSTSRRPEGHASMPAIVIVGAQWGDEGKGKVTDLLGGAVDFCVRYQGGNNAVHTVVVGDTSYELHVLPSGVITPDCVPVVGNGVVVDPGILLEEKAALERRGVSCERLLVSAN